MIILIEPIYREIYNVLKMDDLREKNGELREELIYYKYDVKQIRKRYVRFQQRLDEVNLKFSPRKKEITLKQAQKKLERLEKLRGKI